MRAGVKIEENQIYASPRAGRRRLRENKPWHEVVLSCSLPRGRLPSLDNFYSSSKKTGLDAFTLSGATGIKEAFPEPALPPGVSAPSREPGDIFPGERVAPLLAPAGGCQCVGNAFFLPQNSSAFGKVSPAASLHQPLPSSAACTGLRMVETFFEAQLR